MNWKKTENFEQDELLNKIYRDLTIEEFKTNLKQNEIKVPEKLIKPIFYKFKKRARKNNITVDLVVDKLRHFDKGKRTDNEFLKQYLRKLKKV